MIMSSRIIWSNNGTLVDVSQSLGNFKASTQVIDIVALEDYIYIGSDFPFNHRYIDITTANDQSSSISVDLWDGQYWKAANDIIDQSSVAGVTLAQSGVLSWTKSTRETWSRWDTNNEGEQITGLTDVNILNLYWARLTFSADLNALSELNFIGHKFSDDNDLEILYPDLTRTAVMAQFKAGKTNWKLQHIQAAEEIIKDLKKTSLIKSENQILDWELFRDASVHKVAQIAFNAFGKDFFDNRDSAAKLYKLELDKAIYNVDLNNNATLDVEERIYKQGTLYR